MKAIRITLSGTHEDMTRVQDEGRLDEWCDDNQQSYSWKDGRLSRVLRRSDDEVRFAAWRPFLGNTAHHPILSWAETADERAWNPRPAVAVRTATSGIATRQSEKEIQVGEAGSPQDRSESRAKGRFSFGQQQIESRKGGSTATHIRLWRSERIIGMIYQDNGARA